ncbi:hypothetical protein GCM10010412_084800 [Nonomuraea recticatena]|uniref:Uncharacterized protein n=1 Tax=Nonomuraea recticatena TaxID=46178 RepID=A0ABN3T4Q5_9ACTN
MRAARGARVTPHPRLLRPTGETWAMRHPWLLRPTRVTRRFQVPRATREPGALRRHRGRGRFTGAGSRSRATWLRGFLGSRPSGEPRAVGAQEREEALPPSSELGLLHPEPRQRPVDFPELHRHGPGQRQPASRADAGGPG